MSRRTMIIAGCLALAVLALIIPLMMALDKSVSNATEGSFAYRYKLPDAIKAVPVIDQCRQPIYDHFPQSEDGPAAYAVSYATFGEGQVVKAQLDAHFTGQGCVPVTDGVAGEGFRCTDGAEAFVNVRPDDLCDFVAVILVPMP